MPPITRKVSGLTEQDRRITAQVMRKVDGCNIKADDITNIYINDEYVTPASDRIIAQVIIQTPYALYAYGLDYFRQLVQEFKKAMFEQTEAHLVATGKEFKVTGAGQVFVENKDEDYEDVVFRQYNCGIYSVWDMGKCYGFIERSPFGWGVGGDRFSNPVEVGNALQDWTDFRDCGAGTVPSFN